MSGSEMRRGDTNSTVTALTGQFANEIVWERFRCEKQIKTGIRPVRVLGLIILEDRGRSTVYRRVQNIFRGGYESVLANLRYTLYRRLTSIFYIYLSMYLSNRVYSATLNFFFFVVVRSGRNSGSSNVCCCTLEILHRAVDLLPHRCVSRPSFCSQILVSLTVLREVFHRGHGRCTAAVAHSGFSYAECEHMVPES